MSTHISSGADEVLTSAAESGPEDPLDALLRQIVGGYFVLTDGQGSVSKWSEPAELLFGRPAQEILGQPFFGTLLGPALPPNAESWRSFLEAGEAPSAPGRVEVKGLHAEGRAFGVEAVFVPVKLDEGFDFSLFLEDLGFELPLNLMLLRMRQQHPVVVRALRQAIEDETQPWEGWRTAGTLVVFRPTEPTPWVEEQLVAREAARAEQDAEVEERLSNPDPGVQGSSVKDLDDAAAVVARLLSALERIDDLERMATGLPAQVQEARKDAENSRSRAEAAEREAVRLRSDLERALVEIKSGGNDTQHLELLARMERLERARLDEDAARASALKAAEAGRAELAQRLERAEADRARAAEAIEGRVATVVAEAQRRATEALEEARSRADGARSAFESRIVELEKLRSGDADARQADVSTRLEHVRAEHEEAVQAARHELAETLERIERERERDAEGARAELRAALERIEHVQRESDALREQLTQVTVERHESEGMAGEERRRLAELQRDAEQTRARIDGLCESGDALRGEAAQAREEAAQVRAQLAALQERSGTDVEAVAEELRREQAELARSQQELAARYEEIKHAHPEPGADFGAVADELRRGQQEILRTQAELDERNARIAQAQEELAQRSEAAGERARAEFAERFQAVQRTQEELGQRNADMLRAQEDFSQRHERVAQAHAEVVAEQAELREWVEASHRERDQFRASTEHALAQLAEVRTALREQESSISVQIPSNAVEHEELSAFAAELRGEIGALRDAEAALRGRLEALAGDGEAATARLEQIAAASEAATARLEHVAGTRIDGLAEGVDARLGEVAGIRDEVTALREDAAVAQRAAQDAGGASEAVAARLAEVAGDAEAAKRAAQEMVAAGQEIAARLDEAGEAEDALAARVEAVAGDAAGAREELSALRDEARDAQRTAREVSGRIDEIDRGAGNVLADVRAVRDRVDEVATLARATEEAGAAGRADTDELRTAVARLTGELQVARGELERSGEEALGARQAASTAHEAATAAREDAGRAREETAATRREVESGRERVSALNTSVERLGETLSHTAQAAESARTEATAGRRTGKELAQLVSELDQKATSLRGEMGTGRERLQVLDASVEKLATATADAVQDASAARTATEEQGAALREELAEVRALAERAAEGIEAIRADVQAVRGQAERMASESESNRQTVRAGEERLAAMGAEVTFALRSLDEMKAGLTSAGQAAVMARREAGEARKAAQNAGEGSKDNVTEVFAQLLGLAAKKGNSGIHRRPSQPNLKRPDPVKREPRHNFDDASVPMATLGLDGKFRELNPTFTKLVGYQEHEFAKATWPSPHDRSVYQQQQEQLAQLASGEIESVTVQSTYMHGQGLMVPVVGRLTAVAGEDGLPVQLLLEAEDRHHS